MLGGLFTKFNWRWCFWINLCLSGPAILVLLFFIKKIPNNKKANVSFKDIDFGGIALLTTFVVGLCLSLTWGGTTYSWSSPVVIALLVVGCVFIPIFIVWEIYVPRFPVIPMQMFRIRNVTASTGCYFFISVLVNSFPKRSVTLTVVQVYIWLVDLCTDLLSARAT